MGVQLYLLDRRTVTLNVGGHRFEVGTLRRSWKVTELGRARADNLAEASQKLVGIKKPKAVLVADVAEMALASNMEQTVSAHVVLGWDADRLEVSDFRWDYLPVLGYAIRNQRQDEYILHEIINNTLIYLSEKKAIESGILGRTCVMNRRGQPTIEQCLSVKPFVSNYFQANCVLSDGQTTEILTFVGSGGPPKQQWYAGKRPVDVGTYPGNEPVIAPN
jgi:hypothetical protein